MSATFVIRLDDRREKLNHTYPIKVWVTHKQRSIPYATVYSLSKEDHQKLNSPNVGEKLREIRGGLKELTRCIGCLLKGR